MIDRFEQLEDEGGHQSALTMVVRGRIGGLPERSDSLLVQPKRSGMAIDHDKRAMRDVSYAPDGVITFGAHWQAQRLEVPGAELVYAYCPPAEGVAERTRLLVHHFVGNRLASRVTFGETDGHATRVRQVFLNERPFVGVIADSHDLQPDELDDLLLVAEAPLTFYGYLRDLVDVDTLRPPEAEPSQLDRQITAALGGVADYFSEA